MIKIEPQTNIVYLDIDEPKAGVLDTSSRDSAIEVAEVLAKGEGVKGLNVGDRVMVKAWAIDTITYEGEKYRFVNTETGGILAKINDKV